MRPRISEIQRFCLHDGPGIRTVIFLKGCSLSCPWCANPENISFITEFGFDKKKCMRNNTSCDLNQSCSILYDKEMRVEDCPANCIVQFGKNYSDDDLIDIISRDVDYYGEKGGVTLSGGECLLAMDKYVSFLKRVKNLRINIAVETSLFCPINNLSIAFDLVDLFIVDVKILDAESCKKEINGNLDTYLKNLDFLFKNVPPERIIMRFPIVRGITYTTENINRISKMTKKYSPLRLEIFSVHNLGKTKYDLLGKNFKEFEKVPDEELIKISEKIGYKPTVILH
jgi:pyruvate formate lyase activating enzyme